MNKNILKNLELKYKMKFYPHFVKNNNKCSRFDSLLIHFKTHFATLDRLINTY